MKKLFTIIGLVLVSAFAYSQTIVSTTPQNKKVILEEFTGINCQYCPDGHKIAQTLKSNNPGNVFLINVHTGSYAAPSAGQPDYRTSFGTALASQSGLTGYPAGTVNRHVFAGHGQATGSTAESRSYWTQDAATIMTQPSYVNVGVEAQIDYTTRVLTIHCEVYYTANSTVTSNKLNIALTQNNVKGPQVSGSTYYPAMMTSDGLYRHQHMLRNMFTNQWGITLNNTNTAANTLKLDTTFTYTVPANYISVDVCLAQLEVVAFIAEGNQEIISGNGCNVTPVPVDDASITAISGFPSVLQCSSDPLSPSVKLKNIGADTLKNVVINYTIDGGTPVTQNWTGNLVTGDSTIVAISPSITPTNGHHSIKFYTTLPNGNTDYNYVNDDYYSGYNILLSYSSVPVNEEFTSTTFPPANWIVDGSYWIRSSASSFGSGTGSARLSLYQTSVGTTHDLYVYGLDLSSGTKHFFNFDHAYAQIAAADVDKLQVQVSTNCGSTWTELFNKSGTALKTAPANSSTVFTPTSTQWAHNSLDLTAFDGQSNVLIRFHVTSDNGNCMYIDKVVSGLGFEIDETNNTDNIEVYPNPAVDFVKIMNAENSTIELYDIFGKLITSDFVSGNNYSLNISDCAKGTYILKIMNSDQIISKKITVLK